MIFWQTARLVTIGMLALMRKVGTEIKQLQGA